jgi:tetratricopeptide (TPR) repeat protein
MYAIKLNTKLSSYNVILLAVALVIPLVTVLVYIPALHNGFVNWDDNVYVYENEHIRSLGKKSLQWMLTAYHASNWHPLTWLSHGIDYAVWGLDPLGHHLTSIVLHGLNTFLVVILITRLVMLGQAKASGDSQYSSPVTRHSSLRSPLVAGALTGLLFGIHPLHVESVAWVSERKDVLYAFFYLLSVLSYVRYVTTLGKEGSVHYRWYVLCLVLFVCSLMSKPMAVTLPVVLLILDVHPFGRTGIKGLFTSHWRLLVEKAPFFVLSVVSSVLTLQAQEAGGALKSLQLHSLGERILVSIRALLFYFYKMICPVDLAPLYPYPVDASLLDINYLGMIVIVVGITVFCIWSWKKQKIWAVVWTFYVVTLLPVLGIVQVGEQAAADRYTYLSTLGPFVLAGLGAFKIIKLVHERKGVLFLWKMPALSLFIFLCTLLLIFTVKQIKVWKDSVVLWDYELKIYPDASYVAYYNRGKAYEERAEYTEALDNYKRAIGMNPRFPDSFINQGTVLEVTGSHKQALESYNKAILLDPAAADAYYNRGISFGSVGQYQQAIQDFTQAVSLDPQYALAYHNRGVFLGMAGDYERSISDLSMAIQLNPRHSEAYYNRGITYKNMENYQQAIQDCSMAIRMDPENAKAYSSRGNLHLSAGDIKRALQDYQEAARLGDGNAREYLRSRGIMW